MITFRGLPLVEASDLSFGPGVERAQNANVVLVASGPGARVADLPWASPRVEGFIEWTCSSLAEVDAARDFVDARKGRLGTFWIPSFTRDFEQMKIVSPVEDFYVFSLVHYFDRVFSLGQCRRNFFVERQNFDGSLSGATFAFQATSAGEFIPGDSERVFGYPLSTSGWAKLSMLYLVRLLDDSVVIEWASRNLARARVPFIEVPKEAEALP